MLRLLHLGKGWFRRIAGLGAASAAPAAPGETASHWLALRSTVSDADHRLDAVAEQWLRDLPEYAQPKLLCARHPRVANRLASLWGQPNRRADVLDSLLADERGDRSGFAPAIRAELVRLDFLNRKLTSHPYAAPRAGPRAPQKKDAQSSEA
jgi:hypothetical protein